MARGVGRPKAGQERLSRERIVEAALRLIDAEGIEALSMRRLAGELDVDPMAIYRHLPSKDGVLEAVAATVFAGLRVGVAPATPWPERVRAFAEAYRALVRAHPHLVRHLAASAQAAAPVALDANEVLYGALGESGLSPAATVWAADLVVDYVNGFALAESGTPASSTGRQDLMELLLAQPEDLYPAVRRALGGLEQPGLDASFAFGLEVILAGLAAVAESSDHR